MKRKTNEEFKEEVKALVGSEYIFLDNYINYMTKIKVKHNKCGHEYKARPSSFFQGARCPFCSGRLGKNFSYKQREDAFCKRLEIRHREIKYISGYKPRPHGKSINFKVLVMCRKTGFRYYVYASHLRIKDWQCEVCNRGAKNINLYKQDKEKYDKWYFKNFKAKITTFYPVKCKYCGKYYSHTNNNYRYCSKECNIKYYNHLKHIHKDERIKHAKVNGKYEDITLARLYKRDKGFCYICGKHLVLNDEYNRLEAPTIEHVIPICKGGTNTWDNVKLACRNCNNKKGTKLLVSA